MNGCPFSKSSFDSAAGGSGRNRFRAPAYPDLRQTEWLMDHSEPSAGMEMAELTEDMDALQLASELLPLEMELITIRSLLKA